MLTIVMLAALVLPVMAEEYAAPDTAPVGDNVLDVPSAVGAERSEADEVEPSKDGHSEPVTDVTGVQSVTPVPQRPQCKKFNAVSIVDICKN